VNGILTEHSRWALFTSIILMAAFLLLNLYQRGAKKAFWMGFLCFPVVIAFLYTVITRKPG